MIAGESNRFSDQAKQVKYWKLTTLRAKPLLILSLYWAWETARHTLPSRITLSNAAKFR
jgi:hypothetical protein